MSDIVGKRGSVLIQNSTASVVNCASRSSSNLSQMVSDAASIVSRGKPATSSVSTVCASERFIKILQSFGFTCFCQHCVCRNADTESSRHFPWPTFTFGLHQHLLEDGPIAINDPRRSCTVPPRIGQS